MAMPATGDSLAQAKAALGIVPIAHGIRYFNLGIYGPYGAGKTHLAGTAADSEMTAPMLLIDTEGGAATLRKKANIEVVTVRSIKELVDLHDELEENDCLGFKTVGIDSVTEIQKLDIMEVAQKEASANPREDPEVPSKRGWGKSGIHIRNIVRAYRDLPCHTIFTFMDQVREEADGVMATMPSLPGKLAGEIPGYLDVIGWLHAKEEKGEIERLLQVQPTRRVRAKDRLGLGAPVLSNPTIPSMWNTIYEQETN